MIHVPALDKVMKALTQEARASTGRYMATTNVIPGVHVSVLAKI